MLYERVSVVELLEDPYFDGLDLRAVYNGEVPRMSSHIPSIFSALINILILIQTNTPHDFPAAFRWTRTIVTSRSSVGTVKPTVALAPMATPRRYSTASSTGMVKSCSLSG